MIFAAATSDSNPYYSTIWVVLARLVGLFLSAVLIEKTGRVRLLQAAAAVQVSSVYFFIVSGRNGSFSDLTTGGRILTSLVCHRACSSALNRIRLRAIFLHRAFRRLYRNWLTLHQPPEENLNRSPSRLGPVDGSCGAANTNFCKQILGYSRVSAAEELRGRGCWSFLTKKMKPIIQVRLEIIKYWWLITK